MSVAKHKQILQPLYTYKTFKNKSVDSKFQDERSEGRLQTAHLSLNNW